MARTTSGCPKPKKCGAERPKAVVPPLAEFVGNLGHSTLASLRPELRRWCTAARVPLQGLDQFLRKERLEK